MRAEAGLADPGESSKDGLQDPLVGKVLAGKYLLQALVAKGGMGRIYRAEQQPIGRTVAVKLLSMEGTHARDPNFEQRFSLEAATLGRLRHPNTITMFDYGALPDEGVYYIAMELVEGENLARIVKRDGPFTPGRAVRVVYEVARALVEAHDLGIVHRDLKPANIMISNTDEGERVKVLDFGIAKATTGRDQELTAAQTLMGSPKFMSPEQIRHEGVDQRSDIYSLGVVLFYLMTGKEPFRGATPVETLVAHLNQPIPALAENGVTVPPGVEAVVRRCLEKRPADRYHSSVELKIALKRALVSLDQAVTGPTPTLSYQDLTGAHLPPALVAPRRVGKAVTVLGVAGGILALAVLRAWWIGRPDPAPAPVPAIVERAPAAAPEPATVRVVLTSEPSGAEIVEGDVVLGRTPLTLMWTSDPDLRPRELWYRLPGYEPSAVTQGPATTDQAHHAVLRPVALPPRPRAKAKAKADDLLLER